MATLLKLKREVEHARNTTIKLVFSGASEAHLLADDIGDCSLALVPLPCTDKAGPQPKRTSGSSSLLLGHTPYFGMPAECSCPSAFRSGIPLTFYSLPGPPISSETAITKLQDAGVIVGIGVYTPDFARNARFDLTWVRLLLTSTHW